MTSPPGGGWNGAATSAACRTPCTSRSTCPPPRSARGWRAPVRRRAPVGGDGVTPTPAAKLDATTPKWPVVEANLADPPTVTVGGVTTEVTGDDPQRQIIAAAAAQARGNGRPIRARVTTPGGDVHRLIVTPTGRVTRLDHPTTGAPVSAGKPSRPRKADPSTR